MANSHPRLFFVHVPKCGGMTLHAIIEKEYEPEEIYTVPSVSWNDRNYDALCNEWGQGAKDQIRVVKGHMNVGWHNAFGDDDYEYIALLRHPIERVISYYSFVRDWEQFKDSTLEEVLRMPAAQNLATFMLSGGVGHAQEAYDTAWGNILSGRIQIGTLENFDKFVKQLRDRYAWSGTPYELVNRTKNRIKTDDIPHAQQQLIVKRNWFDLLLYVGALSRMS